MKCPKCPDAVLVMTERQAVEIDYCPLCRGVWLDRGELDKLIERSALAEQPRAAAHNGVNPTSNGLRRQGHDDFSNSDYGSGRKQYGNRKKSWLGDIFD